MTRAILALAAILLYAGSLAAQIPASAHIAIVKAEDARRFDAVLIDLLSHRDEKVRERAALAAGRIGDNSAVPELSKLLTGDASMRVRHMAAFALGEIESIEAADVILRLIGETGKPLIPGKPVDNSRGRLAEAAGKIAAANAKDAKAKQLADAIIFTLEAEQLKGAGQDRETVLLALTAALRARPEKADVTVAKFLTSSDARIRADAANTLSRIRAKSANDQLRKIVATDSDPVARANAARALGAAEDKEALDTLIKAATADADSRVRVSAIRSLAQLKDVKAAEPLLIRGEALMEVYKKNLKPKFIPIEQNEFIEISTALGQILAKTGNARAIALFRDFAKVDQFRTAEPYIARVKVGGIRPGAGLGDGAPAPTTYGQYSTLVQVIGELSAYEPESDAAKKIKDEAPEQLRMLVKAFIAADPRSEPEAVMAAPDALRAFARFKTDDLAELLRTALSNNDVQIRATAAGILADIPASKENVEALKAAYPKSILTDKESNDASLAILDALFKLDKKASVDTLLLAAVASDHLVRRKAFELLADKDLQKEFPAIGIAIENAAKHRSSEVLPYSKVSSTRLGQLVATDADYRRALSRKNGTVRAVFTTQKGTFTIDLLPEDAPLTVDNFVKLANQKYFDGLEVHRVVPNFVMQDGDPRGDGNGGPGWSIRCEVNMVPYDRGAVGMALSGKDTGGSQWFVTHSPQPHLDGGYTVFGRVNDTGMKVVDKIVRGDRIVNVRIVER